MLADVLSTSDLRKKIRGNEGDQALHLVQGLPKVFDQVWDTTAKDCGDATTAACRRNRLVVRQLPALDTLDHVSPLHKLIWAEERLDARPDDHLPRLTLSLGLGRPLHRSTRDQELHPPPGADDGGESLASLDARAHREREPAIRGLKVGKRVDRLNQAQRRAGGPAGVSALRLSRETGQHRVPGEYQ